MKHIRTFENYRTLKNQEIINEELFSGLLNFFKNMWNKAVEDIKKLGENPTITDIKNWIEKNSFTISSPNYLFKNIIEEFKKKDTNSESFNSDTCLDLISNIIDPETGVLGKQGLQPLYDNLPKAFGKNLAPLNEIQYYFNTIRNKVIKDYKYAGGPDNGKVDLKKIIKSLDDNTHLPEFKKALIPFKNDKKKMKEATIYWVEKTLIPLLLRHLKNIKEEEVVKYLKSKNIEISNKDDKSMNYKKLLELYKSKTPVIYKKDAFDEELWNKLTEEEKNNPKESDIIGVKVIDSLDDLDTNNSVKFKGNDGTIIGKKYSDIIGPVGVKKVEGQEDLVNTLKDIKSKDPESIKKIGNIAKLYNNKENNKDKISEIDKIIGNENK